MRVGDRERERERGEGSGFSSSPLERRQPVQTSAIGAPAAQVELPERLPEVQKIVGVMPLAIISEEELHAPVPIVVQVTAHCRSVKRSAKRQGNKGAPVHG